MNQETDSRKIFKLLFSLYHHFDHWIEIIILFDIKKIISKWKF